MTCGLQGARDILLGLKPSQSPPCRQGVADGNLAAFYHLGINAHIDVAEGTPEGGDDVEVAF